MSIVLVWLRPDCVFPLPTETNEITVRMGNSEREEEKRSSYVVLLIITLGCSHSIRLGAGPRPRLQAGRAGVFPSMTRLRRQRYRGSRVPVSFSASLTCSF